jgi:hypothetical protein
VEISRPFIRLPYAFDAGHLHAEVAALPEHAWMAHPAGMKGNAAVPLISRDGGDNDDFDGAMAVTPHLEACPYLMQAMASFGEVLGRSRLMRLAGGCEVSTHVDFNYHWYTRVRIHIPVVSDPAVIFHCGGESLHMHPGECWIFNSWHRHRVINGSDRDRIHLVIDTAGSSRFWSIVREMSAFHPVDDRGAIAERLRAIAYVADCEPAIATERFNTAPVMSPGEIDALTRELLADVGAHPQNDRELLARYEEMLTDFCKDWRETWHRHGYRGEGLPHYQRIIHTLKQRMHPNPRALITRSNEVGINPVIVQRILRPALAPEQTTRFVAQSPS